MTSKPCAVYLIFNTDDELIYVGVTSRGQRRHMEHYTSQSWAHEISRTMWEHFPDTTAALAREHELIVSKRPRYNIANGTSGVSAGKFLCRPGPELHAQLVTTAAEQGVSLNQLVVALLAGGVGFTLDHD